MRTQGGEGKPVADTLFLIFQWSVMGRGDRLGEVIAPDRQRAWEYARKNYGVNVHVQSRKDYEAETATGPRAA